MPTILSKLRWPNFRYLYLFFLCVHMDVWSYLLFLYFKGCTYFSVGCCSLLYNCPYLPEYPLLHATFLHNSRKTRQGNWCNWSLVSWDICCPTVNSNFSKNCYTDCFIFTSMCPLMWMILAFNTIFLNFKWVKVGFSSTIDSSILIRRICNASYKLYIGSDLHSLLESWKSWRSLHVYATIFLKNLSSSLFWVTTLELHAFATIRHALPWLVWKNSVFLYWSSQYSSFFPPFRSGWIGLWWYAKTSLNRLNSRRSKLMPWTTWRPV